ncbi:hypothetical protein MKX01_022565 [Papaver californicum]|nr:hypothetical protein MKX01_022565 [Papaver californicum]
MAMNIDRIEEGDLTEKNNRNQEEESSKVKSPENLMKWGLLLLSCICSFIGVTGGPLLLRLYFLHGGSRKWLSSWLQMAGFPILIIPLTILYARRDQSLPNIEFFASRKLLFYTSLIGLVQGTDNFMYCYGLSFLPVTTSSLLVTTQLASTSFISNFWVKQKFTPYSINAIVVIIRGSILLGIRRAGDRPPGVTNSQYLLGFFIIAYAKANQGMTYTISLQFQVCLAFFATLICTIGSLINKDFISKKISPYEMQQEASDFDLGAKTYYLVLASNMVVLQLMFIGRVGIIFCTSSLFAGVMSATLLPISQIAAVITFHENFTGEKGMALALALWGFTSYFYGSYRNTKTHSQKPREAKERLYLQINVTIL